MKVWRRATVVALLLAVGAAWTVDRTGSPAARQYEPGLVPVTLYFGHPQALGVTPEVRWLPPDAVHPARLVQELILGPRDPQLLPVLSARARVLSVEQRGDTAVIDFSADVVRDHPGGSAGEIMTVFAVVNTLTELPGIRRVLWLIEGSVVETLVGHLDLSRPLERSSEVIVPRWRRV